MLCPFCENHEHRVVESRVADAKDAIRRRRECQACGRRFTTYERCEEMPLVVVKSSGERQPFDRAKLLDGLQRAAVRDIEAELRNRLRHEVRSSQIGELVLRRLKEIDQVAYVRFASVYRAFADVEEFEEELARLEREPPLPRGQHPLDDELFAGFEAPTLTAPAAARPRALAATRNGDDTRTPVQEAPDGD